MLEVLNENEDYKINLEKISNQWWLELQEKATGEVQIVYFANKQKAKAFVKGLTIEQFKTFLDKTKTKKCKIYKPIIKKT